MPKLKFTIITTVEISPEEYDRFGDISDIIEKGQQYGESAITNVEAIEGDAPKKK